MELYKLKGHIAKLTVTWLSEWKTLVRAMLVQSQIIMDFYKLFS